MITIKDVSCTLQGKTILDNISFSMEQGRIYMLLGENGSGKTTLMKTLFQQLPYQGHILYEGCDIAHMKAKQQAALLSYVPQIKEQVEDIRVEDCILAGCARTLSPFALPGKRQEEEVSALLDAWQLSHIKGCYLQEISGGELQLTYVLRAFYQDAQIMVMDEPCTYLDFHRQHQFLQKLCHQKQETKSMLISMHDPNLALQYGDDILFLHEGRLRAHIRKEEGNMAEACCQLYNTCYGNHFTIMRHEDKTMFLWKNR